jgi:hypothetical protein
MKVASDRSIALFNFVVCNFFSPQLHEHETLDYM